MDVPKILERKDYLGKASYTSTYLEPGYYFTAVEQVVVPQSYGPSVPLYNTLP